uniref:RepB n=1 Tax=Corynebacterium striatum TaxID=43770 RepID=Q9FB48_CORST|nr:RepB [Corynebacterium striatum]
MSIPDQPGGTVSLDHLLRQSTGHDPHTTVAEATWDAAQLIITSLNARTTALVSTGANETDRAHLIGHLGRKTLQGAITRDFKTAWRKDKHGNTVPKLYRVDTAAMRRCQYVVLAHKQRSSVVVIDIDHPGTPGGQVTDIHPVVHEKLSIMAAGNLGPSWIGVNPTNGKCQLIWLIDPVYADSRADSSNIRLMKVVTTMLGEHLGGDAAFAHRLSRSPFYGGDDPTAYRWHVQHHRVDRLSHLRDDFRTMTGQPAPQTTPAAQNFSSGRELIDAVVARREQAQQARKLLDSLEGDLPSAEALDGDRIDGVKVLWITPTRAARDETAFRHALATAYKLREAGQKMTDAAIIDAYERAYNIAQAVGADHREPELPPMRDRLTMARRVRGYVLSGKRRTGTGPSLGGAGSATARERKALATMGRKGGRKAAQRWQDRSSDYAQNELDKLAKANANRKVNATADKFQIASWFMKSKAETGEWPRVTEAMEEFGVSRDTVKRALRMAGVKLPRGRRRASN